MHQVNIFQAKTELSKLISALENGTDDEIIIARNGKPVAKLLKWEEKSAASRIGVAKGKFRVPDDFNADNGLIEVLFTAEKP
jgi:antitoxin (DNA-binding transcriptional repressor) of toxin-antitoxin stability system